MPIPTEFNEEYLSALKRKDLLNLCKERGIKATGKNSELIDKLLNGEAIEPTAHSLSAFGSEPPMTPKKQVHHLHAHLQSNHDVLGPMAKTPISALKSIVESVKRTGLHSSPIRVPFALSPMAIRKTTAAAGALDVGTPSVIAKEPSQPIKEAFLNCLHEPESPDAVTEEDPFPPLNFGNKRNLGHFEDGRDVEEAKEEERRDGVQLKREKLSFDSCNQMDCIAPSTNTETFASTTLTSSSSSLNYIHPHSRDLKDPQFASPQLMGNFDPKISRSESQDAKYHSNSFTLSSASMSSSSLPDHPQQSAQSQSQSQSSRSTSQNQLLPSGIVKLLEKKRQERESSPSDHQITSSSASSTTTTTQKKKFNLQESLKRPLSYKPHLGSLRHNDGNSESKQ